MNSVSSTHFAPSASENTLITRVLHVASGDSWAGAEVQLYNLAAAFKEYPGIQLEVVLFNHGVLEERLRQANVTTTVFDEKKQNSLVLFLRLLQTIKRFHPQIVHTHRTKEDVLGAVANLFNRDAKTVCTVHGGPELAISFANWRHLPPIVLGRLSARFLMNRIVCVSHQLLSLFKGFPPERLAVIDNGINVCGVESQSTVPVQLPDENTRTKIGFFGRMVPVKRLDIIVEIAHLLNSAAPGRYAFYLFGDGPYRDAVAEQIRKHQLEHVVYLMGFVDTPAPYLRRMDLLLITSDHEGLPMIVLEALCLKVYVIAHAVGAIPEVLNNGMFGTLVGTQQPGDYVKAIEASVSSDTARRSKTEAAYQHLVEHYSIDNTCRQHIAMYRNMLSIQSTG